MAKTECAGFNKRYRIAISSNSLAPDPYFGNDEKCLTTFQ